jgi:hypothetical protein
MCKEGGEETLDGGEREAGEPEDHGVRETDGTPRSGLGGWMSGESRKEWQRQ